MRGAILGLALHGAAALTSFTIKMDKYYFEHSWQIEHEGGSLDGQVAAKMEAGAELTAYYDMTDYDFSQLGLSDDEGFEMTFSMDLPGGSYVATLYDTYGDGWTFEANDGSTAMTISGDVSPPVIIAFSNGDETSGSFTVPLSPPLPHSPPPYAPGEAPSTPPPNEFEGGEAPASPPSTPELATGTGDPHIVGAHGDKFDFKGEHKVLYSMFSAPGFAVNARFMHDVYSLGQTEVHGSFITEAYVSVQLPGQAILHIGYNATRPDLALLTSGNRESGLSISPFNVNEASEDFFELDGLRVVLSKTHMNDAALVVSNGIWRTTFRGHLYPYATTNHEKKRLDLSFSQVDTKVAAKVAPHGLVGQTFDGDKIAVDGAQDDYSGKVVYTKAMGEGAIEGKASDYVVKSPYSVDFVYSRFNVEAALPRDVSKLTGPKKKVETVGFEATTMNDNPSGA
jgi:hypothetical protein